MMYTEYNEAGQEVRKSNDLEALRADVNEFGGCVIDSNGEMVGGSQWVYEEMQGNPKRFAEGMTTLNYCWFTGGESVYTVSRRTANKVYFTVNRHEIDGDHSGRESFPIEQDENGNEFVTLYEYHGHYNRIYAE